MQRETQFSRIVKTIHVALTVLFSLSLSAQTTVFQDECNSSTGWVLGSTGSSLLTQWRVNGTSSITANTDDPCVDFLNYDCHAFLNCSAFDDPNITAFKIGYSAFYSQDNTCSGTVRPNFPKVTIAYFPPSSLQCSGWWTTAGNALGLLDNHINLSDDFGVDEAVIGDTDYSFTLMVEYGNSGTFVQLGNTECITTHPFACSGPPESIVPISSNAVFLPEQFQVTTDQVTMVTTEHEPEDLKLFLMPNPVRDQLNVSLSGELKQEIYITFIDMQGKKMMQNKDVSVNTNYYYDVSEWGEGVHFCRILMHDKVVINKRFVIVR